MVELTVFSGQVCAHCHLAGVFPRTQELSVVTVCVPREAVYTTLPRVGQPRPTTVFDSLKKKLAANTDVPPLSSKGFDLLLASSAAYQHQQVTGVPLQASLVNSQDWRKQIRISAIAKDFGVQRTDWHCSRPDAEVQHASTWGGD